MTTSLIPDREPLPGDPDPWRDYGALATVLLIAARLISFLGMPQVLFNLYGLLRYPKL